MEGGRVLAEVGHGAVGAEGDRRFEAVALDLGHCRAVGATERLGSLHY